MDYIRKIRVSTLFSIILSMICFIIIINTITAFSSRPSRLKTVTSVEIQKGDTLWSIATQYITDDYTNIGEYIKDIKLSNGIASDIIYEGNYIIVPYFTDSIE